MLSVPDTIKDLLHLDSCKKNIRIHFPNGEREDICNDLIVKDSVQFTESLCSQDTLQFGLCESPVFECEVVGVSNITGATIEVSCEVFCDSSVSGAVWRLDLEHYVYSIPYGTFVVSECKRQADMIHRKVVAYGGTASYDWGMSAIEAGKYYEWSSSNITYTPHALYFCNANDIALSDDLFDVTPKTWSKSSWGSSGGGVDPYMESGYTIGFDGECYSANLYRDDAESIFEIDATAHAFKDELFVFLKEYGHILPHYFDLKYEGLVRAVSLTADYFADNNTFINAGIWASSTEKPPFYFYPYITGLFTNQYCRFDWFMPLWFTLKVYRNGNVLYSKTFTFYSDVTFKVKKLKSWLPDIRLSFPRVKRDNSYYLDFGNVDVQDILSSYMELCGLFGVFDRENKIAFLDIKQQFDLLPSNSLYPNSNLYPQGVTGGKLMPNDYQSCWYDDYYTLPYGRIICTYKDSNNTENLYQYYLTGYDDSSPITSYRTYDLSDNSLIKSKTWASSDIEAICQRVAGNLEGVTYMPVEFVGRGLPYVEAGDTFEILTKSNDSITTIVLNRTLSGEQVLTDSYKSV